MPSSNPMDAGFVAPGFSPFQQRHFHFIPGLSHSLEKIKDAACHCKKVLSTQVVDNVINVFADEQPDTRGIERLVQDMILDGWCDNHRESIDLTPDGGSCASNVVSVVHHGESMGLHVPGGNTWPPVGLDEHMFDVMLLFEEVDEMLQESELIWGRLSEHDEICEFEAGQKLELAFEGVNDLSGVSCLEIGLFCLLEITNTVHGVHG